MEFDFEERHLKGIPLMTGSNIRARICEGCNLIFFVNDSLHEWHKCRGCRKAGKIEIKETEIILEQISDEEGDFP